MHFRLGARTPATVIATRSVVSLSRDSRHLRHDLRVRLTRRASENSRSHKKRAIVRKMDLLCMKHHPILVRHIEDWLLLDLSEIFTEFEMHAQRLESTLNQMSRESIRIEGQNARCDENKYN